MKTTEDPEDAVDVGDFEPDGIGGRHQPKKEKRLRSITGSRAAPDFVTRWRGDLII